MNCIEMVNENFEPSEDCDRVLSVFKEGQGGSEPWGRANPRYIINQTGIEKSNVEFHLRRLRDAGWITKCARGLYEYVEDPRVSG